MSKDSREDRVRDALRPTLNKLIHDLWEHEEAARSFEDPEGVHQMRVASRKLRAAFDTSRGVLGGKKIKELRQDVRTLTRALGGVRDGDVLLGDLAKRRDENSTGNHPGIDRVISRIETERDVAREHLLSVLDELDARGFREESLKTFAGSGMSKKPKLGKKDARRLIEGHVTEFLSTTGTVPAADEVEELHEIRIATKRLRYALQLFEKSLDAEAPGIILHLTDMQDQLGEIHNLDVQIDTVRDELHHIADDAIDHAIASGDNVDETLRAQWNDLVSLLQTVTAERTERYQEFLGWWGTRESEAFTDKVSALAHPSGDASG